MVKKCLELMDNILRKRQSKVARRRLKVFVQNIILTKSDVVLIMDDETYLYIRCSTYVANRLNYLQSALPSHDQAAATKYDMCSLGLDDLGRLQLAGTGYLTQQGGKR